MTLAPIKVLIVDDIEENLVALEALLRRDGLEVLIAHSGAEALELLLAHDISLALLDVQMPEMDGFELAELMRGAEKTKRVPIIFVTAGARDSKRTFKGYETGAVDFLYKPVEPHILRGKVEVFFELARQRRELENALRLNELFVGILGHDLRNPLGAIIAGTEILEGHVTDDLSKKVLKRMMSSSNRMKEMIDEMLDLTRARLGGGLDLVRSRRSLDLHELMSHAIDELRTQHPNREILITSDGTCETVGDPDRLLQLFSNVVGNAIVHGSPEAPVTTRIVQSADVILCEITNQGTIPEDVLPTLFEPFRSKPRADRTAGLGLGLFIAQQIAKAHGGEIRVESRETFGTRFTVRLPREGH